MTTLPFLFRYKWISITRIRVNCEHPSAHVPSYAVDFVSYIALPVNLYGMILFEIIPDP